MIRKLKVKENRTINICRPQNAFGIIGENNAEVLRFELPEKINGADIPEAATWKLLTENATNGYVEYELNGDFAVPEVLTADSILHVSVGCFVDDEMIWKTYPYDFTFANGLNVNAESIVRNAVLKLNYDKLYDALAERGVELPEKKTSPTQTDIDELVEVVEDIDDGESVKVAILADLRGSMTENVGGDYSTKSLEDIIGTPSTSEIIITPSYHDGELYTIREAIGIIATTLDDSTLYNTYPTVNGSIDIINNTLANIKETIIASLNAILEPEEPYSEDMPWFEIKELVENLPDDVDIQTSSAVDSNSAELRTAVDNAISAIVTEYDLDVELVTGTWEATLNNLTAVCAAINQPYEDLISGMEEILGITEGDSDE